MARRRGWGAGQVLQEPSGRWAIRWRDKGQRRYLGGFDAKVLADRRLAQILGDIAHGRAGTPVNTNRLPTLSVLAADWIGRRKDTHRSWSDDRGRWKLHLAPHFGKMRAPEVDTASVRSFVEKQIAQEMNKTTIGLCVRLLSTFFSDLCERPRETGATANPIAGLPKSLRRLYRSEHDPRFTEYLRQLSDVRRLYWELMRRSEMVATAYAVGVCAGLRTGEVLGLEWQNVDEEELRLDVRWQVQNGAKGPLKDNEARIVRGPCLAPLRPLLRAWRLRTGERDLLFPPELARTPKKRMGKYLTPARLYQHLVPSLKELELPPLAPKPWYQATRHTFASHWVRAGHPIAGLAAALGHSTTWVTERYAHQEMNNDTEDPWTLDLLRP